MTADQHSVKPYLVVFGALLALTLITVFVSYLHLARGPAIALGVTIAALKAGLVAAFFMHLKGENRLIYWVLGVTAFFMVVLFTLPLFDSRGISHLGKPADVGGAVPAHAEPGER